MSDPVITTTRINEMPFGVNKVHVRLGNKGWTELFSYYRDELYFNEIELNGFTIEEALEIRRQKDVAYLRS
jgi:hypothetical protein